MHISFSVMRNEHNYDKNTSTQIFKVKEGGWLATHSTPPGPAPELVDSLSVVVSQHDLDIPRKVKVWSLPF